METRTVANGDPNQQRNIDFHLGTYPFSKGGNFDSKFHSKTLNPNGIDPELSLGMITFNQIGAGLENLGNTCFLNSVIQCLTYTEPLAAYLQSGSHQNSCHIVGFCALCAIEKHVSQALRETGSSLVPADLVSNLKSISKTFCYKRQEDAHEYMLRLLESMHRCCLPKGVSGESSIAYEMSLVHKIFGGLLQSQIRCNECLHSSDKHEPFLDLSLDIQEADTLLEALEKFTGSDLLDNGAKEYQCRQCNQKVSAVKQMTVYEPPYVLTIHLKRFCAHDPHKKIDKEVLFCPTLDLKPFVSGSHEQSLVYTLYGVLVHAGRSTRSGHYYCYVRTSTRMWYSLDDDEVDHVDESTVLEQNAYMLFYVRERNASASKQPCDVSLNERMGSLANGKNLPSSSASDLEIVQQNGFLQEYVDKKNSVTATKDALNILKEENGVTCIGTTTSTKSATREVILSESTVSPSLNDAKIKSQSEEVHSPLPGVSCGNTEGSLETDRNASNKESVLSNDVSVSTDCTTVKNLEDEKLVTAEKSPPMVRQDGECSLGVSLNSDFSRVGSDSQIGNIVSAEQPLPSPVSRKTNDQMEVLEASAILKSGRRTGKPLLITMRLSTNVMCGSFGRLCKRKLKQSRQTNFKSERYTQTNMETLESTSEIVSVAPLRQRKRKLQSNEKQPDHIHDESYSNNIPLKMARVERYTKPDSDDRVLNKPVRCMLSNASRGNETTHCICSAADEVSSQQTGEDRVLKDPIVARWDGTLSSNQHMMTSMTSESTRIGHILDEWDEEYDRGKKKKVKLSKDPLVGNRFQVLAVSRTNLKKLKNTMNSAK